MKLNAKNKRPHKEDGSKSKYLETNRKLQVTLKFTMCWGKEEETTKGEFFFQQLVWEKRINDRKWVRLTAEGVGGMTVVKDRETSI